MRTIRRPKKHDETSHNNTRQSFICPVQSDYNRAWSAGRTLTTPTFVISFPLPSSAAAGAALAWSTGVMVVLPLFLFSIIRDCIGPGGLLFEMGRRARTLIPLSPLMASWEE
jgi:hypothetical protein